MSKEQYTHMTLQNRKRRLEVCDDKRNVSARNSFFLQRRLWKMER